MHLRILNETLLRTIPSGSGIETDGTRLYLMGDDTNTLYQLDFQWNTITEMALFEADAQAWDGNRIPKQQKPDLEALTWITRGETQGLLLLGSGSKAPERDNGFWVPVSPEGHMEAPEKLDLGPLYHRLRAEPAIHELNIEAAAALPDGLLLINRGGIFQPNTLIWAEDLFDPDTRYHLASIPTPPIAGTPSGISGACYLPETDSLLLSLSAEVTTDSINDGEIRGSALAILHQVQQRLHSGQWVPDAFALIPAPSPQKIESVVVTSIQPDGSMHLMAVADNDDGTSRLYAIVLTLS